LAVLGALLIVLEKSLELFIFHSSRTQSASGAQGSKPLVLSVMFVREVGKIALYVRKKEWL